MQTPEKKKREMFGSTENQSEIANSLAEKKADENQQTTVQKKIIH